MILRRNSFSITERRGFNLSCDVKKPAASGGYLKLYAFENDQLLALIAQIFMFKPVLLHCTKLLAENLLYNLCLSNFSQKCLLRVEKHAFVKVKLREILVKWFDGKKNRRDCFL